MLSLRFDRNFFLRLLFSNIFLVPPFQPVSFLSVSTSPSPAKILLTQNLENEAADSDISSIVEQVMGLIDPELIQSCHLILYGEKGVREIYNSFILEHPIYSKMIVSAVITEITDIRSSFKDVLMSCCQHNHHIDHKQVILIFLPGSKDQATDIFSQISWFYNVNPSKKSATYFFTVWPSIWKSETEYAVDTEDTKSSASKAEILTTLRNFVPTATVDSHFYILRKTHDFLPYPSTEAETDHQEKMCWNREIWEFYNVNGKYILEPVPQNIVLEFFQIVKRRNDFRGATVRALVQLDTRFNILQTSKTINGTLVIGGLSFTTFHKPIGMHLNYSLEIVLGKGWIAEGKDGALLGMGKQLINNDADFTISFSELLEYRIESLSPSHPVAVDKVYAYFQQPEPGLYRDIFSEAFSPELWILVVVTWIIIISFLVAFSNLKKRYFHSSCSESDETIGQEAAPWAIGIICQQGWHYTPTTTSLQVIFISGLLASLLFYTAYAASIIAIFSVQINPINSLKDLLKYGYTLYGNDVSFTGAQSVRNQAAIDGVSSESRVLNATAALQKIKDSKTALISSHHLFFGPAARQNNSPEIFCEFLSKSSTHVDVQYTVSYFRKFSPLKKPINLQLTRWKEKGLIFRWTSESFRNLPAPCEAKRKEPAPLDIQDVRSAFLIIAAGFLGCLTILAYEIISSAIKKRSRDRDDLYAVRESNNS